MRRRVRYLGMSAFALAVLAGARPADAAEPAPEGPSVCVPPCEDDKVTDKVGDKVTEVSPPQPGGAPPAGEHLSPPPQPTDPPPPPRARRKRGFFALPYLGIHSYQHAAAATYDPGLRVGSLIGARVTELVSINGELTFDASNAQVPAMSELREWALDVAVSPMAQIPAGPFEIALGPKLGLFTVRNEQRNADVSAEAVANGWMAGVNGGVFVPLSPATSLGLLASFEIKWAHVVCVTIAAVESCGDPNPRNAKIVGLAAAAIF